MTNVMATQNVRTFDFDYYVAPTGKDSGYYLQRLTDDTFLTLEATNDDWGWGQVNNSNGIFVIGPKLGSERSVSTFSDQQLADNTKMISKADIIANMERHVRETTGLMPEFDGFVV
ncbi:hypothetical protein MTBPR1_30040 [Candidatus Terasakiella magnetica]|uniref:Uncharacterized protein n=1 Tax=Candidatus Terasakiella magnetica TaxID=1867952 RepID=A0A1C3RHB7_9PROT|nr:hypothetical protein [Candidatus Terasakiella magnetica]SCA56670.1 hypothetical protein MTBPR1_30040 [Candidatus Terasakiella magnetica]